MHSDLCIQTTVVCCWSHHTNLPACLPPLVTFQNRERFSERIGNVADKVEHCDVHMNHGAGASVSGYLVADSATSKPKEESALSKTTHGR